jgi:hypothetical protein
MQDAVSYVARNHPAAQSLKERNAVCSRRANKHPDDNNYREEEVPAFGTWRLAVERVHCVLYRVAVLSFPAVLADLEPSLVL